MSISCTQLTKSDVDGGSKKEWKQIKRAKNASLDSLFPPHLMWPNSDMQLLVSGGKIGGAVLLIIK